jgi:hypothetical protein
MMNTTNLVSLVRRALVPLLLVICAGPQSRPGAALAQVLKWQIEATVVEIEDPEMTFADIRPGDPVRGFLSYDLNAPPDDANPNDVFYEHAPGFDVIGMVIENPRDGSEIQFKPDTELPSLVEIINDGEDEFLGLIDGVLALQPVLLPDGSPAFFPPALFVGLFGPSDNLDNATLPLELNLSDWPEATIDYVDLVSGAFIFAEIHALTLVPEPSSLVLLAAGAIALIHLTRKRR